MSNGRTIRPAPRREVHLDFMRGLAVLMVVDFHTTGLFQRARIPASTGDLGVAMFFVLSGFLVGGILIREWDRNGSIDAKRFLIRRALKIWPQYYAFLIVMLLTRHRTPQQLVGNLFNVQNYVGGIAHTWSLAVEEHAYLIVTLLLMLAARGSLSKAVLLKYLLGILVMIALYRDYMFAHGVNVFLGTQYRIDGILWGIVLAIVYQFHPLRFESLQRLHPVWLAGVLLPFMLKTASAAWPLLGLAVYDVYNLFGVSIFFLLYLPQKVEHRPGRAYRAVAWIGLYSYGIYLWHVSMFAPVTRIASRWQIPVMNLEVGFAAAIAGIAIGIAATHVVELPMLRVRDRLFPRKLASPLEIGVEEITR